MDAITHLFLGVDIAPIPTENWLKIDGITHTKSNRMVRSDTTYPGSLLLVRAPQAVLCMECFFHSWSGLLSRPPRY